MSHGILSCKCLEDGLKPGNPGTILFPTLVWHFCTILISRGFKKVYALGIKFRTLTITGYFIFVEGFLKYFDVIFITKCQQCQICVVLQSIHQKILWEVISEFFLENLLPRCTYSRAITVVRICKRSKSNACQLFPLRIFQVSLTWRCHHILLLPSDDSGDRVHQGNSILSVFEGKQQLLFFLSFICRLYK